LSFFLPGVGFAMGTNHLLCGIGNLKHLARFCGHFSVTR
jgi:hypothetical protein